MQMEERRQLDMWAKLFSVRVGNVSFLLLESLLMGSVWSFTVLDLDQLVFYQDVWHHFV